MVSADWTFFLGNAALFFTVVGCTFFGLVLWWKRRSSCAAVSSYHRIPLSEDVRNSLQKVMDAYKEEKNLILDGKGEIPEKKDWQTFNWNLRVEDDGSTSLEQLKKAKKTSLIESLRIDKTRPGVWTARANVSIQGDAFDKTGTLTIAHLNEERLFANGDGLLLGMEKALKKALKDVKEWY